VPHIHSPVVPFRVLQVLLFCSVIIHCSIWLQCSYDCSYTLHSTLTTDIWFLVVFVPDLLCCSTFSVPIHIDFIWFYIVVLEFSVTTCTIYPFEQVGAWVTTGVLWTKFSRGHLTFISFSMVFICVFPFLFAVYYCCYYSIILEVFLQSFHSARNSLSWWPFLIHLLFPGEILRYCCSKPLLLTILLHSFH